MPPLVSPTTARDFVYVDDAVDALMLLAQKASRQGAVYNLCTGAQTSYGVGGRNRAEVDGHYG